MSRSPHRSSSRSIWLVAWPTFALLALLAVAAAPSLPGGYLRAVVALPVWLTVPGFLTLGAVFHVQRRPRGVVLLSLALLLSAIWCVFVSLLLYAVGVLITAHATYFSLLVISAVLAAVAQVRLWLAEPGGGRRAYSSESDDRDTYRLEADVEHLQTRRPRGSYTVASVVAGTLLLGGGLFVYDHLPHPAPTGYTTMAWTDPRLTQAIAVSPGGANLHLQIIHHETYKTAFVLSAAWLGKTSQPLSRPLSFTMGPNQTYSATLFVPPLPNGCTYRIVVTLSAPHQLDSQTKKVETWSINADVHDLAKSQKKC